LKVLHGTATSAEKKSAAVLIPATAGDGPEPPADLTDRQRAVWLELAGHAEAKKTLVPETMAAFRNLCSAVAIQRLIEAEIEADGLTGTKVTLQMDESGGGLQSVEKKAHTLLPKLTTVMQRVEAGMVRFGLSPVGKPMVEDKPAEIDPFAKFEVHKGGKP
jgi:hypothetical protein